MTIQLLYYHLLDLYPLSLQTLHDCICELYYQSEVCQQKQNQSDMAFYFKNH